MQMVDQNHLGVDGLWAVQKEWIFQYSAVHLWVRVSLPLHPLLSLCLSQTGKQPCFFLCVASQVLPLQSYTGRRFIIAACNASVSKRQYHAMWRIFIWGLTLLHWIGKVHFF